MAKGLLCDCITVHLTSSLLLDTEGIVFQKIHSSGSCTFPQLWQSARGFWMPQNKYLRVIKRERKERYN
uniref:Uncharacterized protein n=1 Tax=Catagonus wagneri TaxID=51154 RepID=A0A8C3WA51_9CETA